MTRRTPTGAAVLQPGITKAITEAVLAEFEQKVAVIGAERTAAASGEVEAVVSKADDVVRAVHTAESRVEALSARVTWTAVGRSRCPSGSAPPPGSTACPSGATAVSRSWKQASSPRSGTVQS